MKPDKLFRFLLRARNTLLWVTTPEERRVERALAAVASKDGYAVSYWDCATGASGIDGVRIDLGGADGHPGTVYAKVRERKTKELWILRDLPAWLGDPAICRGLKSLARELQDEPNPEKAATIVVLSAVAEIPVDLRNAAIAIDWPLPDREEIRRILGDVVKSAGCAMPADPEGVVDAAAGLKADDVAGALALSIVQKPRAADAVDPAIVREQKRLIVSREPTIQWEETDPRGLEAVGGLDLLKEYLVSRRVALTPEARAYGLPAPKGLLLVGVPGNGKSLVAKCVPAAWGLPLLRLDLGALKGKYVGESEGNIRSALKVAEAIAPAILWLDEIEKSLAGAGSRGDGGVAADQLGTILTWLQERHGSVIVIATANDISALPPELSRAGRFDAVFFIDLPNAGERADVLRATLHKFGRDPETIDLAALAAATSGFSGAELAELVPSGLLRSFGDSARALTTEDLLAAAAETVPASESDDERIQMLRAWAKKRARPASRALPGALVAATSQSTGFGRALDLGDEDGAPDA